MSAIDEREVLIPQDWRDAVCAILRTGDDARILRTQQADRDWRHTCPDSWMYQRHEAMAIALELDGVTGRHITDMEPPCDAYEFWFRFESRKFVGKIGLLPDGRVIIVFSSHIPRKGEDRL